MAKLTIVTYPQKILTQRAKEAILNPETAALIPQMIKAMYENDGIGLAAPQIGVSQRIIIVETSDNPREHKEEHKKDAQGKPLAFLNPRLAKKSKEMHTQEEGCLSLPGIFVEVKRPENIHVVCQIPEGKEVSIETGGLIARIFQHEIDHLNGKLIIDHVGFFKKRKLKKQLP